jgi:predicted pyridoxine 5'-phosphate oxidase superfamily flavin-nucleotide-binding protein
MSDLTLRELHLCFEGVIPAVIATASADGVPNVTYLSRVRIVDDDRIALSNQFFSKTARNLAENPRASLMVIDPTTWAEYRLTIAYERTERRGPVFEELRTDVDALAALQGMQDVFKLKAADLYRVLHIDRVRDLPPETGPAGTKAASRPDRLAELITRITRCSDLDAIVGATVDGLAELLGYEHSALLLLDEDGLQLFTIASRGYPAEGVGSEVVVGEGIIGMAAARATAIRVGNLYHMTRYSASVRQSFEDHGGIGPGRDIPVPGLPHAQSRVAVPGLALGELVGVLMVESTRPVAFDETDEAVLNVVASVVANAIEVERARETSEETNVPRIPSTAPRPEEDETHVRFFPIDGSTFLDGEYLIKGVAGRILWSLLNHYQRESRIDFTNKEVRLDPTLELPEFRDNLDSRLILLKRRLDERNAPIRIEKTGRGRFRVVVNTALRLDEGATT